MISARHSKAVTKQCQTVHRSPTIQAGQLIDGFTCLRSSASKIPGMPGQTGSTSSTKASSFVTKPMSGVSLAHSFFPATSLLQTHDIMSHMYPSTAKCHVFMSHPLTIHLASRDAPETKARLSAAAEGAESSGHETWDGG